MLVYFFAIPSLKAQLTPVDFSISSGTFSGPISLQLSHNISGAQIYYTLNGSEPTPLDNLYTSPIQLSNLSNVSNGISSVPTNPSLNYPFGTYSAKRAKTRGWVPVYDTVFKINIVRAKAYYNGSVSEVSTRSYLIDSLVQNRYSLPIVSIVADSVGLFSNQTGIYVYGNHADGNYTQVGATWERITNFEFLDFTNGQEFNQQAATRIHGGGSRHSCKKNLRLYGNYDLNSNFNFPFFENYTLDKFKRILIRAGGHRPDCFPRDNLASLITDGLNLDKQHYRMVILFVNGEYWGIHTIKERVDRYFIQNQYNIDDNEITILNQDQKIKDGMSADSVEMRNLESYIVGQDMSLATNYNYVADRMDVDNYIDYMCSEIYLANGDWVFNNVLNWRKTGAFNPSLERGQNGKFRWILYDLDGAFGGDCSTASYTHKTLDSATVSSGLYSSYTRLFRGLLDNVSFRNNFINRMMDLNNSWFLPSVVNNHVSSTYNILTPEMQENVMRWRYPSMADSLENRYLETPTLQKWDTIMTYFMPRFANRRPRKIREHIMNKWGISDTSLLTVNVNNTDMGQVKVNSLYINEVLPGILPSVYPWSGYYMDAVPLPLVAIPFPGYKFIEWQGTGNTNDSIVWSPNGDSSLTAVFSIDSSFQPILINEVMLSNQIAYPDNFYEFDDWLELYNPNPYSVDISNCKIVKGINTWNIPENNNISANGYRLFWHDNQTFQGGNHANFKLPNQTDTIYFKRANGTVIDSLIYPFTATDFSYGRFPNGSDFFTFFAAPTPLNNNDFTGVTENIESKVVVYPNPTSSVINLSKMSNINLYDMSGRVVLQKENITQFKINNFENGVYLLRINNFYSTLIVVDKN